jgi:hypothetical protein
LLEAQGQPAVAIFDLVHRCGQHDLAFVNDGDAVCHPFDFVQEMGGKEYGPPLLAYRPDDCPQDVAPYHRI